MNYPLVISHSHGKSPFLIGKPPINGSFSMAMLNYQRVIVWLVHPILRGIDREI